MLIAKTLIVKFTHDSSWNFKKILVLVMLPLGIVDRYYFEILIYRLKENEFNLF